jgi:hypothetical protein
MGQKKASKASEDMVASATQLFKNSVPVFLIYDK